MSTRIHRIEGGLRLSLTDDWFAKRHHRYGQEDFELEDAASEHDPIVLVARADGARFEVEIDVFVRELDPPA